MMVRVYIMFGIISVSRALSKSKWKEKFSLESKIMMCLPSFPFLSKFQFLLLLIETTHSFMTQKPLFRCDINWKRKKFFSLSLSLTHPLALCLMASPESSYQHRNFFLLFFAILQTHILVIFLFFCSHSFFFNNNFSALLLKSFSIFM